MKNITNNDVIGKVENLVDYTSELLETFDAQQQDRYLLGFM